jgi:hypothetical protein
MMRFLVLVLMLINVNVVWAQANNPNPYSVGGGLYYLGSAQNPAVPQPFPPNMTGYTARLFWKDIEPSAGSYNWTDLDNSFSQLPAGTKMALDILTGVDTPDWALNKYEADGIGTFSSIWNRSGGAQPPNQNTSLNPNHAIVPCSVYEFPIPWDTTYQNDISNMVTALATHIATLPNNSALVRIGATAITSVAEEQELMTRTSMTTITCGSGVNNSICGNNPTTCTPPLDTAAWQAVGYTPNKVEAAWDTMLPYWISNFPQIIVSADATSNDFPPIDNNGNNTGAAGDNTIGYILEAEGFNLDPYFAVQNNAAQYPYGGAVKVTPFVSRGFIGAQELNDNMPSFDLMMNYLVQNDFSYLEVYNNDATNSSHAGILSFGDTSMRKPMHPVGG